MGYVYAEHRACLFDESGVETLTAVRRKVEQALKVAGAVRSQEALASAFGDGWLQLAALDYMVEKKEIREVTDPTQVWGQHRVFVRGDS